MSNNLNWMNYSIEISNKVSDNRLKVGAILVVRDNQVFSAYCNEYNNSSWVDELLEKIKLKHVKVAEELYLTINNIKNDMFELNWLLSKIHISKIYVGLPDPGLNEYIVNDPMLRLTNVYRYPDILQQKILKQNSKFYDNSVQSIIQNKYYSNVRISKIVIDKLKKRGFEITQNELNKVKDPNSIAYFLKNKYNHDFVYLQKLIRQVLSEAFNEKYSAYDYADDARSIDVDWQSNFMYVYKKNSHLNFENLNIINVGVGSGREAQTLFLNCKNITFVDIAKNGLRTIKKRFPHAIIKVLPAEHLYSIISNQYDLYVSLRTFNSSFFNTEDALSEAYRVIKNNGIIIVSIANGFLYSELNEIIPGLIIPGTEFIDIYRGFSLVRKLYNEMVNIGFKDIKVYSSSSELYLSAKIYK